MNLKASKMKMMVTLAYTKSDAHKSRPLLQSGKFFSKIQ